jgi:DNA-binding NarL/FixJ family response regulator
MLQPLPCVPLGSRRPIGEFFGCDRLEVQKLIVGDLRNAEIAARRHITVKTGYYHVSAILAKLGGPSPRDAGRLAVELTVGP